MRTILVLAVSLLLSISAHSRELFDPDATSEDLRFVCSAVKLSSNIKSVDENDAKSVDSAWGLVSARFQCMAYVSGIMRGSDLHTMSINNVLNKKPLDTTYATMCVPPVSQEDTINSMVDYITKVPPNTRATISAGEMVYIYLGSTYPCSLIDPL